MSKPKLIRITTAAVSMRIILRSQLRYMSEYFEVIGVASPDELHYPQIASQEGIVTIPIRMARTIQPIADAKALIQLIRLFRKERPTIVHTHTPKAGLLGMIAAFVTCVPIRIHTVGGMPLMELKGVKRKVLWCTEWVTYRCAHSVWPNSYGLRDWMIAHRLVSPSKLKVIGYGASNGINTTRFDPVLPEIRGKANQLRIENKISAHALVFSFVGRIAKDKGIVELVAAFDRLLADGVDAYIVLLGTFEKEHGGLSTIEIDKIESHPHIHFLGRADDVRPYFSMSDVFVLPSYREGFPNALMEAGSLCVPSIATDINGCNEIIQDGVNGYLVPSKDYNALYIKMKALADHKSIRQEMGQKARGVIVAKYDNHILWEDMLANYKLLLNKLDKKLE